MQFKYIFGTFSAAVTFCAVYTGDPSSKPDKTVTTISLDPGDGSNPVVEALDLGVGNEHCISCTYSASCGCKASIEIKNDVSNFKVENIQVLFILISKTFYFNIKNTVHMIRWHNGLSKEVLLHTEV